jgi:hypothetical protein
MKVKKKTFTDKMILIKINMKINRVNIISSESNDGKSVLKEKGLGLRFNRIKSLFLIPSWLSEYSDDNL